MKLVDLLLKIEDAIQARNPVLSEHLRAGLSERAISRTLKKVNGSLEPLFDLYRWHDGTEPVRTFSGATHYLSFDELAFFPDTRLHFIGLEMAVTHFGMWMEAARHRPELKEGAGRFFPLFWDGTTSYLMTDLQPGVRNRIVFFQNGARRPFVEAYQSFDEFAEDALRANEMGRSLSFFRGEA